jgi:hypothetical protein
VPANLIRHAVPQPSALLPLLHCCHAHRPLCCSCNSLIVAEAAHCAWMALSCSIVICNAGVWCVWGLSSAVVICGG